MVLGQRLEIFGNRRETVAQLAARLKLVRNGRWFDEKVVVTRQRQ